nr:hypothetical protein [Tanacetum cinerariifolium]
MKKVNSHAKVPSNKTTNRNKPVEQKGVPYKQERQIPTGHRLSIQKTSFAQKKTMTPSSCLRWKPTGKIFKTVGLRWVPTGKIFASNTTKVDSKPLNGSNADISNQYEVLTWSLNVYEMVKLTPGYISSGLVQNSVSPTPYVPPSKKDYKILFQPLFDEYFNPPPRAVSPDPAAVAAPKAVDPSGSPSSTTID